MQTFSAENWICYSISENFFELRMDFVRCAVLTSISNSIFD